MPLVRLTVPEPATADIVPVHVPPWPFGVATTRPAGRLSETAIPVSAIALFGFVIVNVRLVEVLSGMLDSPKAFVIVGGVATVTVADAVPPVPPFVELTLPVVLFFTPDVVPVTLTENVQVPPTAMVALPRLTTPVFCVAVTAAPPPQPVRAERPFGVATTRPAGRLSVNATPVRAS